MKERLKELDGLKGLFCIVIVLHHYYCVFGNQNDLSKVAFSYLLKYVYIYGYLGVEMFFLLSGFLTAYNHGRKLAAVSIGSFLGRRLRRLYPLAFLDVCYGIIHALLDQIFLGGSFIRRPVDAWHILTSFSFLQNGWVENSVSPYGTGTWYICILFLCYCLYWFVARYTNVRGGGDSHGIHWLDMPCP